MPATQRVILVEGGCLPEKVHPPVHSVLSQLHTPVSATHEAIAPGASCLSIRTELLSVILHDPDVAAFELSSHVLTAGLERLEMRVRIALQIKR